MSENKVSVIPISEKYKNDPRNLHDMERYMFDEQNIISPLLNIKFSLQDNNFKNEYIIYMSNNKNINGISFISFGSINSYDDYITIYKHQTPNDYELITNWIDKIDNKP
jgi:hypothetical protein